jgi:hypothetical protein
MSIDAALVPAPATSASSLVEDLLLVSGSVGAADPRTAVADARGRGRPVRSCLDGGGELVVSVSAPDGRRLGIYRREAEAPGGAGSHWAWWMPGPPDRTGWRRLYAGEPAHAWPDVLAAAADARAESDAIDELRRWHAVLGPNGRIYSVSAAAAQGPIWVAWQLDGRIPIARALDALAVDGRAGLDAIATLLGTGAGGPGPWSFALGVGTGRWRLGTSRWARHHEDDAKRRRFAAVVDQLGGDGRFAEVAYKLVAASAPGTTPTRIGRAAEIEMPVSANSAAVLDAEFFLTAPTDRRSTT